jgi:predicted nucleic acid-binding protein
MPASSGKTIQYWDSNLFIDYLMDDDDPPTSRSKVFDRLMQDAEAAFIKIALSYLVIAEVRPKRKSGVSVRKIEQMLEADRSYFEWFPVTRTIAARARRIGSAYGIGVPDSIHVATAIEAQSEWLFTYDGKHENKNDDGLLAMDGKINDPDIVSGKPLRIVLPFYKDGEMFEPQTYETLGAAKAKVARAAKAPG